MFEGVLVANRGEIARRVLRTLRALGIRGIAVYTDADRAAPHVREADDAVRIARRDLDADAIVPARRCAASARRPSIPGYGFLSENARIRPRRARRRASCGSARRRPRSS